MKVLILNLKLYGAKKYCYRDSDGLHITVSGVPKEGVKDLKDNIENFKDDLVFHFENTNKNIIQYNDDQIPFTLIDSEGNKQEIKEKFGVALLPTTYILGRSEEYTTFIEENSGERAKYNEKKGLFEK